jgi:hypothetical protein
MSGNRPTVAQVNDRVNQLAEAQEQTNTLLASIADRLNGAQYTTATVVAEKVAEAPVEAPKQASDLLKEHVESKGLAFARGGRTQLTTAHLQAAVRVLKSGKPEVLSVEGVGKLDKRHITHIAIGRADDGKSVITQYVYSPEA